MTRTQALLGDPNQFALNGMCACSVNGETQFIVVHLRSALGRDCQPATNRREADIGRANPNSRSIMNDTKIVDRCREMQRRNITEIHTPTPAAKERTPPNNGHDWVACRLEIQA